VELFKDIAVQGSCWIWNHSVGMNINIKKKYDRVSIKGLTLDHMIEKIEAQNWKRCEEKGKEKSYFSRRSHTHQ